jgi:hypothetical protein
MRTELPTLALRPDDDDLQEVLRELQFLLLKHPVAAQGAFAALVAEGRRFARTPAGKQWEARLRGSDLVRRGRVVWEVVTMKMLEEHAPTVLPTTYLDAMVKATSSAELEPLLARLFDMEWEDGRTDPAPDAE